jgi:hypothetical protein
VHGSTLNSGGINGFVINDSLSAAPGTSEVILRNLSINGAGSTPGLNGVRFISGKSLLLENVTIQNQKSGAGVSIAPNATAATPTISFNAQNVTVANSAIGILIQPPVSSPAGVRGTLNNVRVVSNTGIGLSVNTTNVMSGSGVRLAVNDSVFSRNSNGVSATASVGSVAAAVMLDRVVASENTGNGVMATGTAATVAVANSTIFSNGVGAASISSGNLFTYTNNQMNFNETSDGAFNNTATVQ